VRSLLSEGQSSSAGEAATPNDEEDIRRLVELRTDLKERIASLESEIERWRVLLSLLDQRLGQVSFKKAEISETPETEAPEPPESSNIEPQVASYERSVPLKSNTGILLGELQIGREEIRVVPTEGLEFRKDLPPFETFLIGRIFERMKETDEERANNREIPDDTRFSYEINENKNGIIGEILIKNYRTTRRLQELRNSIRWTLDKMYERASSKK